MASSARKVLFGVGRILYVVHVQEIFLCNTDRAGRRGRQHQSMWPSWQKQQTNAIWIVDIFTWCDRVSICTDERRMFVPANKNARRRSDSPHPPPTPPVRRRKRNVRATFAAPFFVLVSTETGTHHQLFGTQLLCSMQRKSFTVVPCSMQQILCSSRHVFYVHKTEISVAFSRHVEGTLPPPRSPVTPTSCLISPSSVTQLVVVAQQTRALRLSVEPERRGSAEYPTSDKQITRNLAVSLSTAAAVRNTNRRQRCSYRSEPFLQEAEEHELLRE